jgi:hypothetical protein
LATLGGAAAAWPLAARAQQAGKLPTIGFLGASPSIESQRVAAFVQRLRELAWIDGRNLAIEYRWAEGRNERYTEAAAELVRLKVDVDSVELLLFKQGRSQAAQLRVGMRGGEEGGGGRLGQREMSINYRSHFAYRIDMWDAEGENVLEHLAGVEDLRFAKAIYLAACKRWPRGTNHHAPRHTSHSRQSAETACVRSAAFPRGWRSIRNQSPYTSGDGACRAEPRHPPLLLLPPRAWGFPYGQKKRGRLQPMGFP